MKLTIAASLRIHNEVCKLTSLQTLYSISSWHDVWAGLDHIKIPSTVKSFQCIMLVDHSNLAKATTLARKVAKKQ